MTTGILASFFYYGRYDFTRLPPTVPLILDSGAFSAYTSGATVTADDYGRWLSERYAPGATPPPRFAFNLDVLADEHASLANWRRLRDHHGHVTTPVLHYGTHPEAIEPYMQEGADRVALGGVATGAGGRQAMAWAAYCLRYLHQHHPSVPVHGLGVHMRSQLARLPWDTTDSSSFTSAWRYARLALWLPPVTNRLGRWVQVDLDGRDVYRYGATLRRYYGTEPERIHSSTPELREELVRVATRIECRAADDWDRTHASPTARFVTTTRDPNGLAAVGDELAVTERYLTTKPSVTTGVGLDAVAYEAAGVERFLASTTGEPHGLSLIAHTAAAGAVGEET